MHRCNRDHCQCTHRHIYQHLRVIMLTALTLAVICTVGVLVLGDEEHEVFNVNIEVHVTNCDTGRPVEDARITIFDPEAPGSSWSGWGYTDEEGNYSTNRTMWAYPHESKTALARKTGITAEKPGWEVDPSRTTKTAMSMSFLGTFLKAEVCMRPSQYNLVFLHGWMGEPVDFSHLAASVRSELEKRLPVGRDLIPDCSNTEDVDTWAQSITAAIPDSWSNLILIGHSMGGKAALRALAHNESLAERTAMLISINTPYRDLQRYNRSILTLCGARTLMTNDRGACSSLAYVDSCNFDAGAVINHRGIPVVALVSCELRASSRECDLIDFLQEHIPGYIAEDIANLPSDMFPNHRDDGVVPLDAQACPGMTVIPYGQSLNYCHSDCTGRALDVVVAKIVRAIVERFAR